MAGKCPVFKAFVLEMPILSVFQRFLASRKVSEKSGWFHYRVAGSGLSPKLKIRWWRHRVGSTPTTGTCQKGALQNRHLQRALFVGKIDCGREECGKYGSKPCGIDIRNQTPAYLPASSVENIPLLHFTLSFSQTHGFSSVRVPASSTTFSGQTPWPAGTTRRGCSPCPG